MNDVSPGPLLHSARTTVPRIALKRSVVIVLVLQPLSHVPTLGLPFRFGGDWLTFTAIRRHGSLNFTVQVQVYMRRWAKADSPQHVNRRMYARLTTQRGADRAPADSESRDSDVGGGRPSVHMGPGSWMDCGRSELCLVIWARSELLSCVRGPWRMRDGTKNFKEHGHGNGRLPFCVSSVG